MSDGGGSNFQWQYEKLQLDVDSIHTVIQKVAFTYPYHKY